MQLLSPIHRELQVGKIMIEDVALVDDENIRSMGAAFELVEDIAKNGLANDVNVKIYISSNDKNFIVFRESGKIKLVEV